MTESTDRTKVLVGVDGSDQNRAALAWAMREARLRDCELIAVHAWHLSGLVYYAPGYLPIASDELVEESTKLLQAAVAEIPDHDEVKLETRVVQGGARAVLSRVAAEPGVRMLVVGTRGRGRAASVLGSVSHALTHHCPKPLVVVPSRRYGAGPATAISRIVVGVDGSPTAAAALQWAAGEAAVHGALLEVVTAWSSSASRAEMHAERFSGESPEAAARTLLRNSVEQMVPGAGGVNCIAREGYAPTVLLDVAEGADLLVVGSRGRGMASELILGSTSHQCVHRSPIPVVIVPPEEDGHG